MCTSPFRQDSDGWARRIAEQIASAMRYGNVTGKEWNSVPFPGQGEVSKDGKKPADAKIKTSYVTSMGKKGKR